jgi:hypothetical protein
MAEPEVIINALLDILNELIDGSAPESACVLNPEDPDLLSSLNSVSAEKASAAPSNGGAAIVAHVDHLRYGFEFAESLEPRRGAVRQRRLQRKLAPEYGFAG